MSDITESKFNEFAEEYKAKKQKTLLNILLCGKILHEAKQVLAHGEWLDFLEDLRVSESERTAQRLLSIYKNYRHLVDEETFMQTDALSQLGVTHLLELQKLPDRFKKEVQIKDAEEGETVVKVIDEDKLSDFLDQRVEHEGKLKPVRDLPLNEMKKYIQEAQGIYQEENPSDHVDEVEDEDEQEEVVPKKDIIDEKIEYGRALRYLQDYHADGVVLVSTLTQLNVSTITVSSPKHAEDIKKEADKLISICEAVIVACMEVKDKIQ
jgi:hypothetical protein